MWPSPPLNNPLQLRGVDGGLNPKGDYTSTVLLTIGDNKRAVTGYILCSSKGCKF